ncbi:hypothetical protein B0J11DRAFT_611528 [Dendryphion nanum]|uniref:Uncharacterized protein n=1 Tax=Dendryphion nanum TaxID=256645 RepID=A0A9P9EC30_9PLEO|nr:hypothetical protein B0J11DRAFT_611528 [Dendryphion nanum]
MHPLTLLSLLLFPLLTTAQRIKIHNQCSIPIYLTSVSATAVGPVIIAPQGNFTEPYRFSLSTGTAIKISTTKNGILNGGPHLVLGYTYNPDQPDVYYNLDSAKGFDPLFEDERLLLEPEAPGGQKIVWDGGPGDWETKRFVGETNLVFSLCGSQEPWNN